MSRCKDSLRGVFERLGYSVHRWPANRFDGMRHALLLLRRAGYAPKTIIDCGAHVGAWTCMARSIFPDVALHLIEPQPACAAALANLARRIARLSVHPVAVTEPGVPRVRMVGGGEGGGTGAWVIGSNEVVPGNVEYPATTLDSLLGDRIAHKDRALLKLDLEGHELFALRGGVRLLQAVEVVLTEVRFFEINGTGGPSFVDVVDFFRTRDFELYDFACLSPRPRDMRLRMGDVIFVHRGSPLLADQSWE